MVRPVLEVEGLTKRFGALTANQAVTLDLRPGEIHALIGPNGAGKSTLVEMVTGHIRPDRGRIVLAGKDVTAWSAEARAGAGLGRTFQVSTLALEHTALQNAVLGALGASGRAYGVWRPVLARAELTEVARAALARVGLSAQAATLAGTLSHGQRRQLEVAVALTLRPKAFLMDEPMAGLGPEGSRAMTTLLDGLRREAPVLLIEHDMDAVFALADRISVLVAGRVIATGTPAEIRADAAVRAAYLGDAA